MPPRRSGLTGVRALALCVLLLPYKVATLQQEQHHQASRPEDGSAQSSGVYVNEQVYKKLKDTAVDQDRESAIAALAPTSIENVVRAPRSVQQPSQSTGLSSPQSARSLQDWAVEDFILLATVDGSIYARDRRTGSSIWALEADKPSVETIYHEPENVLAKSGWRHRDDYLWIIEPSQHGDIYIFSQIDNSLQRLGMTVRDLAEKFSPYAGESPNVVYTAEKKNTLYTVDAKTGRILKTFSSQGSTMVDEGSCRRVNQLAEGEECTNTGSVVLGRIRYTIGIQDRDTADPICTLSYTEWVPNLRDQDLHDQYSVTMDDQYVYTFHDGTVRGFDYAKQRRTGQQRQKWVQYLSSPVVRVFDVARRLDSDEPDPQLVLLPQPIGPLEEALSGRVDHRHQVFVNQTVAGGWYAMSERSYPLVTGRAPKAKVYNNGWLSIENPVVPMTDQEVEEGLVGVHDISNVLLKHRDPLLTISAPPDEAINDTPPVTQRLPPLPSTSGFIIRNSGLLDSAKNIALEVFWTGALCIGILFFVFNRRIIIRYLRSKLELRDPLLEKPRALESVPSSPTTADSTKPTTRLPLHNAEAALELPDTTLTSQEINTQALDTYARDRKSTVAGNGAAESSIPEELQENSDGSGSITMNGSEGKSDAFAAAAATRSRSTSFDDEAEPRTPEESEGTPLAREPKVRIIEPDDEGPDAPTTPGKKRARRGVRGGKNHKKKKGKQGDVKIGSDGANDNPVSPSMVEEIMHLTSPTAASAEPQVVELKGSSIYDVSGPLIKIGHLVVNTDIILGMGSHGTIVYRGQFGGRDVAVKRMLRQYYDIAAHEVGLLQESDDHSNVVRYYDKEDAGDFLYIALELCPASMQEVIEKPEIHRELVGPTGLDPTDVLRQITDGVKHLHSLKIVHRDIKPQNILVGKPKKIITKPDLFLPPRFLISDFGLCKRLEGDKSSFGATTAHAAGTSGWRAPELLVDDDAVNNAALANGHTNFSSTNQSSEPLVLDPQTNRRATRAIDIFSLGCVFFYVLTNGSHPFDSGGRYLREANIVRGNYDLDSLDFLGVEAKDLVASMLAADPKDRPDASEVLAHPFFWDAEKRLDFLCHVSDGFEFEQRDPPSPDLQTLETWAYDVMRLQKEDFLSVLPHAFKDTLGKQRKYQGNRMLDLLRALRNKKNHYEDMPANVKNMVGPLPEGYLAFWVSRFPRLLMACHRVIQEVGWENKPRFARFYKAD